MSYTIREFGRGRISVCHKALEDENTAGRVREFLAAVEGLTRVEIDCRDGSLLLEYDTSRLGHADLFLLSRKLEALVQKG